MSCRPLTTSGRLPSWAHPDEAAAGSGQDLDDVLAQEGGTDGED